jgi:hypothetical protein
MDEIVSRKELAALLRRSEKTIRRWDLFLSPARLKGMKAISYDYPAVLLILKQRGSSFPVHVAPELTKKKNQSKCN